MRRALTALGRLQIAAIFGGALVALSGCGTLTGALRADPAALPDGPTTPGRPTASVSRDDTATLAAFHPVEVATESGSACRLAADELASAGPEPVAASAALDTLEPDAPAGAEAPVAAPPAAPGADEGPAEPLLAQTQRTPAERERIGAEPAAPDEDYDPWEPFNETMFEFNRRLDRWVLKPVAQVYNVVIPEPFQIVIANGFDNISFVPRVVNSLLQGKVKAAGVELSRFLINSTLGIGGLFDAAKYWGIQKSREDFGQTLAVWGAGPGPFLILPFLEPLTVRDGIGKGVDGLLDPLAYFLPFFFDRLGMKVGEIVNDRSLNLELFQGFEESTIDMYSAVRHGYLRRREKLIRE